MSPWKMNRKNAIPGACLKGQATMETAAAFIFAVPILLFLVDVVVVISAMQLNAGACRDAARLAAAGPPVHLQGLTDPLDTPYQRATSMLSNVYKPGGYVAKGYPKLATPPYPSNVKLTANPQVVITSDPGVCGGWYRGTVTVLTELDVNLPVQVPGYWLNSNIFGTNGAIKLYAEQAFPLTYQRPRDPTQCPTPN